MLRVVKSVLAGIAAVLLWAVVTIGDALITVRIRSGNPTGVGQFAIRIGLGLFLTAAAIFLVGFLWQFYRGRPVD